MTSARRLACLIWWVLDTLGCGRTAVYEERPAPAPERCARALFSEDWESGASRWRPDVTIVAEEACSTAFQRETQPTILGRAFTRESIAVEAGERLCLSVWIRGSSGARPFIGINLADASGTPSEVEHWLIGAQPGYSDGLGGEVTVSESDGRWHWYTKGFAVDAPFVVIKDELWIKGAAGTADFDDVSLQCGECPSAPARTHACP